MPDYIYLLENRLSADQQSALRHLREAAREAGMILFLTGDAVRDLTSGHAVRELEVAVHGNALKLKKPIEKLGGKVWGEDEPSRTLYLCFPGTVRVDVVSTHRSEYPKPGKPVFHTASIQEDLRRRDFTVNAMAISLNEGSFGLLMDPLNGAADIEARTLRLVSNYGFLEQPSLLIRATRYRARLGWELEPRTQTRYDNAREEGVIEHLSAQARSQELEQIGHEDDGLKVLRALEAEGWMKVLFPAWTSAKADEEKLKALHELAVELLVQGVHADMSAAQMQLLTARLSSKELGALKKLMLRPGFVEEWNSLDAIASAFAKVLMAKQNLTPSASFKLFTSYDPEAVLWLGFTSNTAAVKERYELFLKVWPEARQRIPHALMQEMRITPELPAYASIVHQVFLELIDGRLTTPEEIRAFLEPHSPPAPPPQVTIKRSRAKRGAEVKVKERSYEDEDEEDEDLDEEEDLDDISVDDEEIDLGIKLSKRDLVADLGEEGGEEAETEEPKPAAAKREKMQTAAPKPAKEAAPAAVPPVKEVAAKRAEAKPAKVATPAKAGKPQPSPKPGPTPSPKPATVKHKAPAAKAKPAPAVSAKKPVRAPAAAKGAKAAQAKIAKAPVKKVPAKVPVKASAKAKPKTAAKAPAKAAVKTSAKASSAKSAPAKKKPASAANAKAGKASKSAKPAAKKPAPKPARRR
jgi:tRNA nucleotidyltransferase (CCA-adding enzyme)